MENPSRPGLAIGFVGTTQEVIIKDGQTGKLLFAPIESFPNRPDFQTLASVETYRPQGTVPITFRASWNAQPRALAFDVQISRPSTDIRRVPPSHSSPSQPWQEDPFFLATRSSRKDPFFLDASSDDDDFFIKKKSVGHVHQKTAEHYPLKIRAGVNQGLFILNSNQSVEFVFTDSLNTCSQVIWRNRTATFCVHIDGRAPRPETYLEKALKIFNQRYGAPEGVCFVVSGEFPQLGDRIAQYLNDSIGRSCTIERVKQCDGCRTRIADGDTAETPRTWGTNTPEVGGTLTTPEQIAFVLNDAVALGAYTDGDYRSGCPSCEQQGQ